MHKVIVTGANGFVGSHLVNELLGQGFEVISVAGKDMPVRNGVKPLFIDLVNEDEVKSKLDFNGVDGVIHLAGLAAVGDSFSNPLKYIEVNCAIQINIMEAALEQKSKARFVVISSGSVYSPDQKLPLTETSRVSPSSPYSVSKLAQENLAEYYVNRGLSCIVARPFNHIGPGQNSGFIVPDLIAQVMQAKQTHSSSVMVGNINTRRDYTDVRDITRAYILLLISGQSGETYNICSGKSLSGEEILNQIMKTAGVKLTHEVDIAKIRPVDVEEIYGDFSKLNAQTGWKPEIALEQTISDIFKTR